MTLLVQDFLRTGSLASLHTVHGVKCRIAGHKASFNYDQINARDSDELAQQCRGLILANGEALDTVVTRVVYDAESDTAKVGFKAVRHLTEVEVGLIDEAQDNPETERYTKLTVAAVDGATAPAFKKPLAIEAAPTTPPANPFGDDDEEVESAPTKRASKPKATAEVKPELASVLNEWLDDDAEG